MQAHLAAEGGINATIGRMQDFFASTAYSGVSQAWVMRNNAGGSTGETIPLRLAKYPSFKAGTYSGATELAGLGYTGLISSERPDVQLSYAVKITSASSGINVNGGDPSAPITSGYNAHLVTFLDRLREAMIADPTVPSDKVGATLGARILGGRPASGFSRLSDLTAILDRKEFEQLRPFLSVRSWIDPTTIKPHPLAKLSTFTKAAVGTIRQTWNLEVQPRAPIDVNSAPEVVLAASLIGLSARTLEAKYGKFRTIDTPPIDAALAATIAAAIVTYRESIGPWRTWDKWDDFCDFLAGSISGMNYVTTDTLVAYRARIADVVRAATNPNSRLNKFNPNREFAHLVDKSDLLDYNCEFSLQPGGVFRFESEGRVTHSGRVSARSLIRAEIRIYSLVRHTTQLQFEEARTAATDADVMTWPGNLADSARAAHEDGQILLAPSRPAASGDQTFHLFAPGSLVAPTGSPTTPWAEFTEVDEFKSGSPLHIFGKDPISSATDASDLLADGLFTDDRRMERLIYDGSTNRPLVGGSMEFWYKVNWDNVLPETTFLDLVNVFAPIDSKTLVSHSFFIKKGGKLYSSLYIWDGTLATKFSGPLSPIGPFDLKKDLTYRGYQTWGYVSSDELNWSSGQWHHIAIRWNGITEHDLYVDGVLMTTTTKQLATDKPLTGSSNPFKGTDMINHFQVGCYFKTFAKGYKPLLGYLAGTIDQLRVYSTQKFPKGGSLSYTPERYTPPLGSGRFFGKMTLPSGARLGTISWTEYRPRSVYVISSPTSGGQKDLMSSSTRPDLTLGVETTAGGGFTDVTGAGADGAGSAIEKTSTGTLTYRIRFDDKGLSPFNAVPVLDDVTVTYFETPAIYTWENVS